MNPLALDPFGASAQESVRWHMHRSYSARTYLEGLREAHARNRNRPCGIHGATHVECQCSVSVHKAGVGGIHKTIAREGYPEVRPPAVRRRPARVVVRRAAAWIIGRRRKGVRTLFRPSQIGARINNTWAGKES